MPFNPLAGRVTVRSTFGWGLALAAVFVPEPVSAQVTTVNLFSPSNNAVVPFQVYIPPGYTANPTQHYPVVYSLHGIGGTSQQRANVYAPVLDAKINTGQLVPSIWVFPSGQTNSFYGNAFDGHKQVYSNVIGEVLPHVDANYRTIATRQGRAMEGFSMGGFGAAMYTAKHPELFSAVLEYGGALATWQNLVQFNNAVAQEMYNGVESNWLPYSLYDRTAANAPTIASQVNYKMIVGDADSQLGSNIMFRNYVISLGIDPQFQIVPGVEHVATQYLNEGSGIAFLNQHFTAVPEPSGLALTTAAATGVLAGRLRRRHRRHS